MSQPITYCLSMVFFWTKLLNFDIIKLICFFLLVCVFEVLYKESPSQPRAQRNFLIFSSINFRGCFSHWIPSSCSVYLFIWCPAGIFFYFLFMVNWFNLPLLHWSVIPPTHIIMVWFEFSVLFHSLLVFFCPRTMLLFCFVQLFMCLCSALFLILLLPKVDLVLFINIRMNLSSSWNFY